MNSKVIFLDVDGTLVNRLNQLPESAAEAVRLANRNGHKIYLCTGRSMAERTDETIEMIHANGAICSYGACIISDDELLFHHTIEPDRCREIIDYLEKNGSAFYSETRFATYASSNFLTEGAPLFASYEGLEYDPEKAREYIGLFFGKMVYDREVCFENVEKFSYGMLSMPFHESMKQKFPEMRHGIWGAPSGAMTFAEISAGGISKAEGMRLILNHLGKTKEDSIAFGDSDNDLPMFDECSFKVAMGNGSVGLKHAADLVTDGVDDNGLFNAFKHLKLI